MRYSLMLLLDHQQLVILLQQELRLIHHHELTSDIKIMNGGSGFIVGDVLTVTGIATTTSGGGFTAGHSQS